VKLQLVATPQVVDADGKVTTLALRDAALLAWLAIEGPTPRQRLTALLWPESSPEAGRNTLRQRLFQLRKQLGADLVEGGSHLALAAGVVHDLDDADDVLRGVPGDVSLEFDEWLAHVRGRCGERVRARLQARADEAEQTSDWAALVGVAQQMLAQDPRREDGHRLLMRAHYLRGDRAAALLAFDQCEQVLKHEVGTQPDAQTLALLDTINAAMVISVRRPGRAMPASVLRPPRLVGRDAEWLALRQAWQERTFVLVAGEPGMGKTRLLSDQAQIEGTHAVFVTARPGDDGVPFALLSRLVHALVRRVDALDVRHRRALACVLPELAAESEPSVPAVNTVAFHEALNALLTAAAAGGVMGLLVDDLQHADAASLEGLQRLMHLVEPMCWQLAYRTGPMLPAAQRVIETALATRGTREVHLAPLGLEATAALVDSLGVPTLSGSALAPALLRRTGGNPMYLLETLKQQLLQPDGPTGGSLPTATGVVRLISQRLMRLSPDALRLARCAAIAGQDFSIDLAERVLASGPLDLADAWSELEAAHVLHGSAFAHDLVHEAAQALVPLALARRLHGLVAQVLAERGAPAQRVAAHGLASDAPQQAVPHLLEASRIAASAMRPHEAMTFCLQAADLLEAAGRHDEALQALVSLFATAYSPADGQTDAVLLRLDQLVRTPHERALVADRRADILSRAGDFEAAATVANGALAELDVYGHPALAARLLSISASGDIAAGAVDRAIEHMHRAMDLAGRSADLETEAVTAAAFGAVLDHAHRYADGYLAHRRAYELALRRPQAPIDLISVAANIAGNRTLIGHFDAAVEMCHVCYRAAGDAAIDLHAQWPSLRVHHAWSLLHLGEYGQAIELFEDARADIARYMPSWLPAVDNMITQLWMHLGQWARARRSVRASLGDGQATLPRYRARAMQLQAEIGAALGERPGPDADSLLSSSTGDVGRAAEHHHGLMRSLTMPPDDALVVARRLRAEAVARQMPNLVLEAEARCAQAAARAGLAREAADYARDALARLRDTLPTNLYRGEVWLAAARAFGQYAPQEQAAVLRDARLWIESTAKRRIPEPYRDSFLHRNPVNRELLALASRLGC
jgi:DNA-binding SARP family transcriptional activator